MADARDREDAGPAAATLPTSLPTSPLLAASPVSSSPSGCLAGLCSGHVNAMEPSVTEINWALHAVNGAVPLEYGAEIDAVDNFPLVEYCACANLPRSSDAYRQVGAPASVGKLLDSLA